MKVCWILSKFEYSWRSGQLSPKLLGCIVWSLVVCLMALPGMASGTDSAEGDAQIPAGLRFADRWSEAGIGFVHFGQRSRWCALPTQESQQRPVAGLATNEKILPADFADPIGFARRHLIRMNGSGVAWIDYDGDLDWDLYFVNGAGEGDTTNALFRNDHGFFIDVTEEVGVGDLGEGMAVAAADYDNDGWTDLLITNFGSVVLYRNLGNGRFENATSRALPLAGRDENFWYGGATWGDYDRDGDLDLYLAGYVDLMSGKQPNSNVRFPMSFSGLPNTLLRNRGDGTFEDVTAKVFGQDVYLNKSMQVLFNDFNNDGWPDLFVGNDTDPNSFFLNLGDGTFKEDSGPSGLSSTDGTMGLAYGDYDEDGMMDLFVTNFAGEAPIFYRLISNESSNDGKVRNALFTADFRSPALLSMAWPRVGWGTAFADLDNDGDLDLFIANGHLNSVGGDNSQQNLLFENRGGGRFQDASASAGIEALGKRIHRGLAVADYDLDGRLDILVTNNGEKVGTDAEKIGDGQGLLLRNVGAADGHWLGLRLEGTRGNRDAIGARVLLKVGGRTLERRLLSGLSYFSTHAPEIHFGLSKATTVEAIEVFWPNGNSQSFPPLATDRWWVLTEGGEARLLKVAVAGSGRVDK